MSKHEEYAELCALAMIGEASASELNDLKTHLHDCPDCRQEYQEFTQLVLPQLSLSDDSMPGRSVTRTEAEARAIRSAFIARAQSTGIAFTPEALRPAPAPVPVTSIAEHKRFRVGKQTVYRGTVAASLLLLAALGGYGFATKRLHNHYNASVTLAKPEAGKLVEVGTTASLPQPQVTDGDAKTIADLETKLREASQQLEQMHASEQTLEASQAALQQERTSLQQAIADQQQKIVTAQQQGQASLQTVADLRTQLNQLQAKADSNLAYLAADEVKIQDLNGQVKLQTASLDRERDMLSAGKDVRDLMAARNLHIVDVVDTDGEGKTKPIFGRVFFTENKQLIFYAYDLNESRLQNAKFSYRVWGEKHGSDDRSAKSLGLFYSDDKTQKRWVFKYDDPKVLSEIDSVFVTLEPSQKEGEEPHGQKMMYAYLRGQPNHP